MFHSSRLLAAALIAAVAAACSPPPASLDPPGGRGNNSAAQEADWALILQLETQAKALAKTGGCTASSDCRSAAVGQKACGGPRYYLPWCAKSTDSAALYSKLAEITKAEQAYNQKYQITSTCEFRVAPIVVASGGSCVAQ